VILRIPEKDLPWLSTYLRGSLLHHDAVEFDRERGTLHVGLERPALSSSRASRWLALLPLLPLGETTCLLTVGNVEEVELARRGPLGHIPQLGHKLLAVKLEEPRRLVIAASAVRIVGRLTSYEPLELTDTAEPGSRIRLADLFGRVPCERPATGAERVALGG
jgi:hypothetical protein